MYINLILNKILLIEKYLAYLVRIVVINNHIHSLCRRVQIGAGGCISLRKYRIWLSDYLAIWLSGYLVIWLSGYLVIWLSGYLVIWLQYLAIWLSGYLAIWLSGYLAIWLSGYLTI